MRGLDPILSKGSHLSVLRVLFRSDDPLCGREIQRRCGLSNRGTMLALDDLSEIRVLKREVRSAHHIYSINRRHYLWSKGLKPVLEAEENFWEDLRKLIRGWTRPAPEAAIVTGELTRCENPLAGPLDVHVVFATGRERLQAYTAIDRLKERIHNRMGLEARVTLMDPRTMEYPEHQKIWRVIAKEGVLLFGKLP